jgi:hypothetical protein
LVQSQTQTTQAAQTAASTAANVAATQASANVNAQAARTVESLAKEVVAALDAQRLALDPAASARQQNQLNLIQKLVEDVSARTNAGANTDPLAKSLEALATALAAQQPAQPSMQSLMASMMNIPVPPKAVAQNYDGYDAQIALLRNELEHCNQQLVLATARRNDEQRKQATLNYFNTMSMYRQQCNVCPSCPNAMPFY